MCLEENAGPGLGSQEQDDVLSRTPWYSCIIDVTGHGVSLGAIKKKRDQPTSYIDNQRAVLQTLNFVRTFSRTLRDSETHRWEPVCCGYSSVVPLRLSNQASVAVLSGRPSHMSNARDRKQTPPGLNSQASGDLFRRVGRSSEQSAHTQRDRCWSCRGE